MVDLAPPPSEGSEVSGVASGVTSSSGAGAASVIAYQRSQIADLRRRLDAVTSEKSALESTVRDLREKNAGLARKLSQCSRRCRAFGRGGRRSGSWNGSVFSSSDAGSCSDSSDDEGSPPPRNHHPEGDAANAMDALEWSAKVKDAQVRELTAQVQASYEFIAILRDQNSEILREKNVAERKLADAERAMSDRTPIQANGLIGRRRAPSAKDGNDGTETSASALTSSCMTDGEAEAAVQRTRAERAERERDALRSLLREVKEREEKRNRRSSKSRSPSPQPAEEREEEIGSGSVQQQQQQQAEKKKGAEADRSLISDLRQKLSGTEEELRKSREEIASLKEEQASSAATPSQNFDLYYEPAVKNLKFLLDMRERAVKDARTERDEALREAELLRKQNEQFRYSTRRGAAPPSSPTAEALPPAVHANLVHSAVA